MTPQLSGEHNTGKARMEQCFTLATDYFPEGEVTEKPTPRARRSPLCVVAR